MKWSKKSVAGAFDEPAECETFREELAVLQQQLYVYARMLADMAGVEDLTNLEGED